MYHTKSYEIKSTDDIELGIKRDSLLEFKVSYDDEKPMKALLFFIAGVRDSDYLSYEEHLAEFVVQTYEVAVIRVDYHCIGFRPQTGATLYMDKKDKEIFAKCCEGVINLPKDFFCDENLDSRQTYAVCDFFNKIVGDLKSQNKVGQNFTAPMSASIQPTKNEYQNFGVMQALDILNALCFVKKNPPFKLAKDYKTLLFGTSHGGYLALLCAKFAPWLIDGVVENSGYIDVPLRFLGFGKESDFIQCHEVAIQQEFFKHIVILGFTKTHFTTDKNSPNCFTKAHQRIRNPLDKAHIQIQATHQKPIFISYHSIKDDLALPQDKQKFYEILFHSGFEATLHLIDESKVDDKFIKNLTHGMNMSLKTLIQKELPPLLAHKFTRGKNEKREIIYPSENLEYRFKEKANGFELKTRKI